VGATASATTEDLYMDVQPIHNEQVRKSLANIQLEGTAMVAALRANSSIPYSVIPNVIESANIMIDTVISVVKSETVNILQAAGVSCEVLSEVNRALNRQSDTLNQPLGYLATRYKQDQHCNQHPLAVKPETVVLGERYETRRAAQLVYDSYRYVSVDENLAKQSSVC
jgi:hypothetical protein